MSNTFFDDYVGIVTLCGSTRFFFEFTELTKILTFKEWIVLTCGSWGHSFHKYENSENLNYDNVKKLHFQKILMSDAIVVVFDNSGYVGESTRAEISFAMHRNIPIFYYNGEEIYTELNYLNSPVTLDKCWDTSLLDFWNRNNSLGF